MIEQGGQNAQHCRDQAKIKEFRKAQSKVVADVDEQRDPLIRMALRTSCEALGHYIMALVWTLEESVVKEG